VPWLVIDTPDMAEVVLLGESMLYSGAASVSPVLTRASLGMASTAHSSFIMSQSCNKEGWKIGSVALPLDCSVRAWLMKCVMHRAGCASGLVLNDLGQVLQKEYLGGNT